MNALTQRHARICKNIRPYEDHDALLLAFATLNRCKAGRSFDLEALRRGSTQALSWHTVDWDGCDHPSFLKRDRRAAMILTEPYGDTLADKARAEAVRYGLVCHSPPNPWASFWFPGSTHLVVLTRPDFGEVRWLPDQLTFRKPRALAIGDQTSARSLCDNSAVAVGTAM